MANPTEPEVLQRLSRLLDYLAQDPDNPRLLDDVVDAQVQLGQWQEARAGLERALQADPGNARQRYRMAVVERVSGRTEAACALLRQLIGEGHEQPVVLQELARALAQQGDWEAATDTLSQLDATQLPLEEGNAVWLLRIRAARRPFPAAHAAANGGADRSRSSSPPWKQDRLRRGRR